MKTFTCNFGGGVIATMTSPDEYPEDSKGKLSIQTTTWSINLTKKIVDRIFPRYKKWVFDCTQILADDWGVKILYCLQTPSGDYQMWAFTPGELPRLQS